MRLGATAADIGATIHAHPTLSEAIMEASEALHNRAIHMPKHNNSKNLTKRHIMVFIITSYKTLSGEDSPKRRGE